MEFISERLVMNLNSLILIVNSASSDRNRDFAFIEYSQRGSVDSDNRFLCIILIIILNTRRINISEEKAFHFSMTYKRGFRDFRVNVNDDAPIGSPGGFWQYVA